MSGQRIRGSRRPQRNETVGRATRGRAVGWQSVQDTGGHGRVDAGKDREIGPTISPHIQQQGRGWCDTQSETESERAEGVGGAARGEEGE
jgi:hypothetical protein